jgi:hypothetical protein
MADAALPATAAVLQLVGAAVPEVISQPVSPAETPAR